MFTISHCRVTIDVVTYRRDVHLNMIYECLLAPTELMNPGCAPEYVGN